MKETIKVSVIVPVYNVADYLPRCLDSLVNQTIKGSEIILINDGSTDGSQRIIDDYAAKYPDLIRPYYKENGGLSSARNEGLRHIRGEFVSFVDSDDYCSPHMLERMYNEAKRKRAQIVVCGYYKESELDGSVKEMPVITKSSFDQKLTDDLEMLYVNPCAWNKLTKSDLFLNSNIRFPEGLIYEDIPTMYPIMLLADRISVVREPLYHYINPRKGSIMASNYTNCFVILKSLSLLNERFKDMDCFELARDWLCRINLRHIVLRYHEFFTYQNKAVKERFLKESFDHLDKYFEDWQNNFYFDETKSRMMRLIHKNKKALYRFWQHKISQSEK